MGIRLAESLIGYHNSTQELGPLDISGTVRAWRTPDRYTDTRTIPNNTPPPTDCLRPPQLYVQPEVRVELLDPVTENVLATTYSDLAGNYVLTAPAAGTECQCTLLVGSPRASVQTTTCKRFFICTPSCVVTSRPT